MQKKSCGVRGSSLKAADKLGDREVKRSMPSVNSYDT